MLYNQKLTKFCLYLIMFMFKLTNRHKKQVILLVSYICMSLDIIFELGLLISAAGGPGEIHDVTEFHISGTFSFLMFILE